MSSAGCSRATRRGGWSRGASPSAAGDPDQISRVAFDIEALGERVRLTVTHTDLDAQSLKDISGGWPAVLSNLKTLLETGRAMPDPFSGVHNHPKG